MTLTGSVALMILMGTLMLAGPVHAVQTCDHLTAGTQAYGECMVRAADREAAPIIPPAAEQQQAPVVEVVETSTTAVWQLAVAGLVGAALAIGATLTVSRQGQRERATVG